MLTNIYANYYISKFLILQKYKLYAYISVIFNKERRLEEESTLKARIFVGKEKEIDKGKFTFVKKYVDFDSVKAIYYDKDIELFIEPKLFLIERMMINIIKTININNCSVSVDSI